MENWEAKRGFSDWVFLCHFKAEQKLLNNRINVCVRNVT